MIPLFIIVFLVVLQRIGELMLSAYNTRRLKAEGAMEVGAKHYPLFIFLHVSWLIAILVAAPVNAAPNMGMLAAFIVLQFCRVAVVVNLGRYWTTRIITLPDRPLVKTGIYRYIRHPNYLVVVGEFILLPGMFGEWWIAIIWSIANALLLAWRIRLENAALRERALHAR